MTQNKIEHLRNHLFEALEMLKDDDKPMEIDRARAIADVARVIVDSAKVEIQFMNTIGGRGTGFIPAGEIEDPAAQKRLIEGSGRR